MTTYEVIFTTLQGDGVIWGLGEVPSPIEACLLLNLERDDDI